MQNKELDRIDKKILNILMVSAKTPLKEIAEAVFLSIPAVSARIEKLERESYITGYQAQVDPRLTGFGAKAFIQVDVPLDKKETFYGFAKACPFVMECCCVTGDFSMHLQVCFPSMEELEKFAEELQQFGATKIQVVFSTPIEHRGVQIGE